jgi:fused signal recognition particle receptor
VGAFTDKLKSFFGLKKSVSAELFEELSDLLVEGDFGPGEAFNLTERLEVVCKKEGISEGDKVRVKLSWLLEELLQPREAGIAAASAAAEVFSHDNRLSIIMLLGINGVGKTTTAAKLAKCCLSSQKKPILAAGDTFRAAAIDQLKIHGERLGVRVVAHQHGGNPAAVVYDAIEASEPGNVIIADTAGRMHTKSALVEELNKIDRVVESKETGARYLKWLVLDATTGRNVLSQAEVFKEAVAVNGAILTKFDSSAKGGAVFSLVSSLNIPVLFVCNGEKYEDIYPFNASQYAKEFAGV